MENSYTNTEGGIDPIILIKGFNSRKKPIYILARVQTSKLEELKQAINNKQRFQLSKEDILDSGLGSPDSFKMARAHKPRS